MNATAVDVRAISLSGAWKNRRSAILLASVLMLLVGPFTSELKAQQDEDPLANIGIPPLSLTIPTPSGYINAGIGLPVIEIPITSLPQRAGKPFSMKFEVTGVTWAVITRQWAPYGYDFVPFFQSSPGFGGAGWGGGQKVGPICSQDGVEEWDTYGGFTFSMNGTIHPFPITTTEVNTISACRFSKTDVPNADGFALDGSGYHMYVNGYLTVTAVYAPDGTLVYSTPSYPNSLQEDSNGNELKWYDAYPSSDTVGRTVSAT